MEHLLSFDDDFESKVQNLYKEKCKIKMEVEDEYLRIYDEKDFSFETLLNLKGKVKELDYKINEKKNELHKFFEESHVAKNYYYDLFDKHVYGTNKSIGAKILKCKTKIQIHLKELEQEKQDKYVEEIDKRVTEYIRGQEEYNFLFEKTN